MSNKTTIIIGENVNVQALLSPRVFNNLRGVNTKTLATIKHQLLVSKYSYSIDGATITIYDVPTDEIYTVLSIINF